MGKKLNISVLFVLALILALPASLQAASATGNISISDYGTDLKAKFKIVSSGQDNAGNGFFSYSDGQGNVRIKVTCLKIDGEYAWFAGKCVEDGVDKMGSWFFAVVHDGGKPGRLSDQIWWEWISQRDNAEEIAKGKVENLEIPSERKLIKDGDITVTD